MRVEEFVNARLDDDERFVRAVAASVARTKKAGVTGAGLAGLRTLIEEHVAGQQVMEAADAGAPNELQRMLREIEAKRRIVAGRWGGPDHHDMWEDHVRLLACIYRDHSDYDTSWKPADA